MLVYGAILVRKAFLKSHTTAVINSDGTMRSNTFTHYISNEGYHLPPQPNVRNRIEGDVLEILQQ